MQDRPTASELVQATKEHLEREVIPALKDPKLRFQTLVAANVLSIVQRELAHGEAALRDELASLRALQGAEGAGPPAEPLAVEREVRERTLALCAAIRQGTAPDPARVLTHVRRVVSAKLAIANPAYKSLLSEV